MDRKLLIAGAIFGLTGVILGAFGAHSLKGLVDAEGIASYETGVRYQIYHAFLLLLAGSALPLSRKTKSILFYLIFTGIILFSGSIYLLSTQTATGIDFSGIALLTPLGGVLLISAWVVIVIQFFKREGNS